MPTDVKPKRYRSMVEATGYHSWWEVIAVYECQECGAFVGQTSLHDRWHEAHHAKGDDA